MPIQHSPRTNRRVPALRWVLQSTARYTHYWTAVMGRR